MSVHRISTASGGTGGEYIAERAGDSANGTASARWSASSPTSQTTRVKTTRVPSIRSKRLSRDLRVTPVTPVVVGENWVVVSNMFFFDP